MTSPIRNAMLMRVEDGHLHRWAKCWEIIRTDGVILRSTEHNAKLSFRPPGQNLTVTFDPSGGFSMSAVQTHGVLKMANMELNGIVDGTHVTTSDLSGGLYDDAEVREYLVDWTVEFLTILRFEKYWIGTTIHDGETWSADVEGAARWLARIVGSIWAVPCRYDLGDGDCMFDVTGNIVLPAAEAATSLTDVVTVISRSAVTIDGADLPSGIRTTKDMYDFGRIFWTSGNNQGKQSEIRNYVFNSVGPVATFHFQQPVGADIQVGDKFAVTVGCDKKQQTCIDKFGNIENHGGNPFIVGEDKARGVV